MWHSNPQLCRFSTGWVYLALWLGLETCQPWLVKMETLLFRRSGAQKSACLAPLPLPGASPQARIACCVGACLLAAVGPKRPCEEAMGRDPSCCFLGFLTLGPQLSGGGAALENWSWCLESQSRASSLA